MALEPFVQGDTGPSIISTLSYTDTGDPINLTDCDVVFQMRKPDDRRYTVNAVATVTDAVNGKVRYDWGANDLSVHGEFQAQFEVTFPDTRIQTTEPPETLTVRRQ